MEDLTGKQFGPYHIIAPLGEGGMAAVFKAYQPAMERYVALKVLPRHFANDSQFTARFQREAKLLAKLQHPHILPVYDFGQAEGYNYIVMPYVPGGTLTDLLSRGPLPLARIRLIITQIGEALNYAHVHGMIHRDVKSSNILIDESGNCLLTDFGLARMIDTSVNLTGSGTTVGTPAYMSPEQGAGQKVDARSDIYSLGVVLYEMATGRVPYKAETPIAVIFKHIQDPLPPAHLFNPDLPEAIELIILKALSKRPEDRYQTAADMVRAIQVAAPGTLILPAQRVEEVAEKPKGKIPAWAWWATGLIVLLAVVIGGLFWKSNQAGSVAAPSPTQAESTATPLPTAFNTEIVPTSRPALQNTAIPPTPDPRAEHRIATVCNEKSICILDGFEYTVKKIDLPELPGKISGIDLSWSPDGKRLVMSVVDNSNSERNSELFLLDVDTALATHLTKSPKAHDAFPTWSPDGQWIAFRANEEALIISPDGKNYQVFSEWSTETHVDLIRWSPDSSTLAWINNAIADPKFVDVELLNLTSGNTVNVSVTDVSQRSFKRQNLAWDPDGIFLYVEFWDAIQSETYRINTTCMAKGCSERDVERVEFEIPDSWLPNYYPQWADAKNAPVVSVSSTQPATNQFGNALQIPDDASYGRIPYNSKLDQRQAITLEAWVKVNKFPSPCVPVWAESCGFMAVISQGYTFSTAGNFTLAVGQKGFLFAFEGRDTRLMAYVDVPENEWFHVALSHTYGHGDKTVFYLNGKPVDNMQWVNDYAQPISGDAFPSRNGGSDYYVGQYGTIPGGNHFVGVIDELRVWIIARTQEEIVTTMNSELAGNESGLVAYWNFNVQPGETTIPDISGNSQDMLLSGKAEVMQRK